MTMDNKVGKQDQDQYTYDNTNEARRVNVVAGSAGGTEYTEGDTDATIDGVAMMGEAPSDTLEVLQLDASKHLQVDIAADSVGIGGGTQYTEDAAAAGDPVGNAQILVRQDTPAGLVTTDGDNVARRGTNYGAAFSQILDSSGNFIDTFGGGTQYTEADTDSTITGTAMMWEDAADTLRAVSATYPLPISDAGGAITIDGSLTNISGTISLPTGAATEASLATVAGDTTSIDGKITACNTGDVTVGSSALPSGAATSANQTTIIGHVDGIEGLLGTMDTDTGNIATNTTDIPNVIGTDGVAGPTKAVSIGGTQATGELEEIRVDSDGHPQVDVLSSALPSGAATESTLSTLDGKVTACNTGAVVLSSGTLTGITNDVSIDDGGNSITVDAPTGTPVNVQVGDGTNTATIRNLAANDSLNVAIVDGSGGHITSFGGGTQYTLGTDTYAEATSIGTISGVVRNDVLATLVNTDNEISGLQVNAKGSVYTDVSSVLGSDMSATNTLFTQISDGTAVIATANPFPIHITDTSDNEVKPGDNANNAIRCNIVAGSSSGTEYTEDAAAPGDPAGGVQQLVRLDTPATITDTDGDVVSRRGTNYGAAYTQIVTSGGAFVDSFGGSGGCAQADKSSFTEGTTDHTPIGGVYNETPGGDPSEDQAAVARITAKRAIHTNLRNNSGTEIGTDAAPVGVEIGDGTTQAVVETAGTKKALNVNVTDGTNDMPTMDAVGRAGYQYITDGTETANVNASNQLEVSVNTASGLEVIQGTAGDLNCTEASGSTIATNTGNVDTNTTDIPNVIGTDGGVGPTKCISIGATESGGNIQELLSDSDGHLQVDVLSGGGGTEYTEDATASGGESGLMMLGVRRDADTSPVTADNDYHSLIFNDAGALKVEIFDGGGSHTVDGTVAATQSGSWDVTSNSANIATESTLSTLDGKVTACNTGAVVLSSGTLTNITNDVNIADNGNSITVDAPTGTPVNVQIGDGTNTATIRNLAANDSLNVAIVDAAGDQITSFGGGTQYTLGTDTYLEGTTIGTTAGVVRNDTLASLVNTDNEITALQVNASGALYIQEGAAMDVSAATVTVDNGGTFAVQSTLQAGSAIVGKMYITDGVEDAAVNASNQLEVNVNSASGLEVVQGTAGDLNCTEASAASILSDTTAIKTAVEIMDDWDASDRCKTTPTGDVAHDTADSGNPVKIGGVARTANPTAVAGADRVDASFDDLGRQIVVLNNSRDLTTHQHTQIASSSSETTIMTAVASTFLDLTQLILTNQTATAVNCTIKDSTAGTTRMIIALAANGGAVMNFPTPVNQATVNNNWTCTLSNATTTVNIFAQAVKNV